MIRSNQRKNPQEYCGKLLIGQIAAGFVDEEDTIYIDVDTTTTQCKLHPRVFSMLY